MTVPAHPWMECRPVLLSLGEMSSEEIERHHRAVATVWNQLSDDDRLAFHRACCLNSRAPNDLRVIERISKAIAEAV